MISSNRSAPELCMIKPPNNKASSKTQSEALKKLIKPLVISGLSVVPVMFLPCFAHSKSFNTATHFSAAVEISFSETVPQTEDRLNKDLDESQQPQFPAGINWDEFCQRLASPEFDSNNFYLPPFEPPMFEPPPFIVDPKNWTGS